MVTALLVGVLGAGAALAAPAVAAPVYEITARWVDDTPATVASGDVVNAEWRVNVNDDAEAPSNDPVDNVNFTLTIDNGTFQALPDSCLTSDVTPPSSISDDGRTLVCNLGTQDQGSAHVLQTPILAEGPTGSSITGTGTIDGATADLDPIEIVNEFGMDMAWETPTSNLVFGDGYVDVDYQWTLFLDSGSEAGPNSVSYIVDVDTENDSAVTVAPDACSAFSEGNAPGHPWSGGAHPDENTAPFVGTCSLTSTGTAGQFTLTLTDIDYSLTDVPTRDSTNAVLPADRLAVASGSVTFRIATTTQTGTTLTTDAPDYDAPGSDATDTDDGSNNVSSKHISFPGGFSSAWDRAYTGAGGTSWDNSYQVSRGTEVRQGMSVDARAYADAAPDGLFGVCEILDSRYVTLVDAYGSGFGSYPVQYYVGTDPTVDPAPGNTAYDPNAFDCGIGGNSTTGGGGWVTSPPDDLSTVKAVRAVYPASQVIASPGRERMNAVVTIKDTAPIGQDIWSWGTPLRGDGVWVSQVHRPRQTIPDARYPHTHVSRDVLHVVSATPAVDKAVDRSVVRPGVPATYTLTYSANGAGGVPPTVDGYELVDTLPLGMSYVDGSADPAPTVSTDNQGREVLTWTIDGVPTNTENTLTYQAEADDSVTPGDVLTNTAEASYGGLARSDDAQVTVSTTGSTLIAKTTDQWFIANPDGDGSDEAGSWTVTLRSQDPLPQAFTDTIDILPYNGDGRGTDYSGSYDVTSVDAPAGATVYYTTAAVADLSDDPADASNGAAGDPTGNTVGWSTTPVANPTAIRVIGGELAPGATSTFQVNIQPDGAAPGDVWVNRAQAIAEHTELVMRTSEPLTMGTYYSASLKKYVQDAEGVWRDANDVADYPLFRDGDTVRYRIGVENTGQGVLTDVEVSDDQQPQLGSFVIDELAVGETEFREFEIVLGQDGPETVINEACATIAPENQPNDVETPVQINCDPAGFEVDGDPTHDKTLVSATPVGGGQWEVVYGIEVTNTSTHPTSYSLDDTLHFTDQATIDSATVTDAPDAVTLEDPEWDGQDNPTIATGVPLPGSDDQGYAPHVYELTVVADVPLQLTGAGSGDDSDPTRCPDGGDSDTAFNNTSVMTEATGEVEEDQACAEIPSIEIDKSIVDEPTQDGDGAWSITYEIDAVNTGAVEGVYDLTDRLRYGTGITVTDAQVVATPGGVSALEDWTGQGAESDAANVVAEDVALPAGETHTYRVQVTATVDTDDTDASTFTCPEPGTDQPGGFANTAGIGHNGLTATDEACAPPVAEDPPADPDDPDDPPPPPSLPETGTDAWIYASAAVLLIIAGTVILAIRRRQTR
ncbi:hypothetical protein GCM10023169_17310 [Georgenia halophila]|uniref:DUF11 domain-containing protein n=1 Tax=Georgenia halophila TaxID=620889 RepID=A0ABP8L4I8_9MICO